MREIKITSKCFSCGRKLGKGRALADTRDSQIVFVGSECIKLIGNSGKTGYQPPKGGPRLYTVTADSVCPLNEGWAYDYIQFLKMQKLNKGA